MKNIKILRRSLIFWTFFIGIGALVGSTAMIILDPTGEAWGMVSVLEILQNRMPFPDIFFKDFVWSGVALFCVCGFPQLATAVLLLRKNRYAVYCGIICGILLILWICLEFVIWGFALLSVIYFVFGVLETVNGVCLYRKEKINN